MTGAIHRSHREEYGSAAELHGSPVGRATTRPTGLGLIGLLTILAGAWGAVGVFVGPGFGYTPTSESSWQWTTVNWLLYLIPGAVAVLFGLVILGRAPRRRAVARGGFGLAGLLIVASGAWFVVGPAVWPLFESGPVYQQGGHTTTFLYQLGVNLGPGLLLAVLGGMALKSVTRDRAVDVPGAAYPAAGYPAGGYPAEPVRTAEPVRAGEPVRAAEPVAAAEPGRVAAEPGRAEAGGVGPARVEESPTREAAHEERVADERAADEPLRGDPPRRRRLFSRG